MDTPPQNPQLMRTRLPFQEIVNGEGLCIYKAF